MAVAEMLAAQGGVGVLGLAASWVGQSPAVKVQDVEAGTGVGSRLVAQPYALARLPMISPLGSVPAVLAVGCAPDGGGVVHQSLVDSIVVYSIAGVRLPSSSLVRSSYPTH